MREMCNILIKGALLEGRPAAYRSSGWSLCPRVHDNDRCTNEPVIEGQQVAEGDIVFNPAEEPLLRPLG